MKFRVLGLALALSVAFVLISVLAFRFLVFISQQHDDAALNAMMPLAQKNYLLAHRSAGEALSSTSDDSDRARIIQQVRETIRAAVPGGIADHWVGEVRVVNGTREGDLGLTVRVGGELMITNFWNDDSDMREHTLIPKDSALSDIVAKLRPFDRVEFSAVLLGADDPSEEDHVERPNARARFTSLKKLSEGGWTWWSR